MRRDDFGNRERREEFQEEGVGGVNLWIAEEGNLERYEVRGGS